jgi:methyltransferase-like protein/SAM-dependent methyltransferase
MSESTIEPETATTYDELPYTSYPYARSHPDRLATIGRLFGMRPADLAGARVLELGCASGGNLIPIAEELPGAELVGVDLSARQVKDGQAAIAELGLANVRLVHADLREVDEGWGRFDYVVCHGVFSWVPRPVQDRILEICARNLQPQGIAYLSYNTYPGWHLRESVRHMMRWHVAQFDGSARRTEQAAALVEFLAKSVADQSDPYALLLRRELDILARTGADYLFHEHLEEHNQPCYFHELVERLAPVGLQYLGESDVQTMLGRELPAGVTETLGRIAPDLLRLEQYMDFVRNRQFRQTLLCNADIPLRRALGPDVVSGLHVGFALADPSAAVDFTEGVEHPFITAAGLTVASARAMTKAALVVAARAWPQVVPFEALTAAARTELRAAAIEPPAGAAGALASDLLSCFFAATVELRTQPVGAVSEAGPRPRVSAYARWQAQHGAFATSRRHLRVDLDPAARHLLPLLDGEHDLDALVGALHGLVQAGTLRLSLDDGPIGDPEAARTALRSILAQMLATLGANAMLLA